jgi:spore cortex formation protein SpoVR/YcgB (stage V sporulation)
MLSLQSKEEINALQRRYGRDAYPNQVKITDEVSLPE